MTKKEIQARIKAVKLMKAEASPAEQARLKIFEQTMKQMLKEGKYD